MPTISSADLQPRKEFPGEGPEDKILTIELASRKRLPIGEYVFQLVVTDDANNVSAPATFTVIIADEGKPIAKIDGEKSVPAGKPFKLTGEGSFDPDGGKITKYVWMLIKAP
jgi:hypothetical protein